MRRLPVVPRLALVVLAAVVPLLVVACGKGRERADTTAASSARPAPPVGARAPLVGGTAPAGPQLPGALAKPVAQYTPDEFYDFVHSLAFGGGIDKPRKCRGNPKCALTGGDRTSARVDAVDGLDSLSSTLIPANGVVAVRARNTGALTEERYGLLPGAYEYYVVVMPGPDSGSTWTLQQLGTTAGARTLTQVGTGTFHPCGHPWSRKKNRANFYTCEDSPRDSTTMRMGLMMQDAIQDPIWMACARGCCTVI